jgi:predicted PurR-regulated permease PerM
VYCTDMQRQSQKVSIDTDTILRFLALTTTFVVGIWLIKLLHHELIWIGVAFFLAVALDPFVSWIAKRLPGGRLLATTIVFVLFVALLVFLGISLIPPLISQTIALANQLPHFIEHLQNTHSYVGKLVKRYNLVQQAKGLQSQLIGDVAHGSGTALGVVFGIFSSLAAVITTLVITFFMLLEGPRWLAVGWHHVPKPEQSRYHRLVTHMYRIVSGYMTGNLIIAAVVAVVTAILTSIVAVPYAIPLGIVAGLATLIPLIGGVIAAVVVCGVAVFTSATAAIVLIIYFVIYILLDGHVLRPLVYGKTLQMSSLVVMVAIVLGTALDGIIGALVAIPLAACLGVLLQDFLGQGSAKA